MNARHTRIHPPSYLEWQLELERRRRARRLVAWLIAVAVLLLVVVVFLEPRPVDMIRGVIASSSPR